MVARRLTVAVLVVIGLVLAVGGVVVLRQSRGSPVRITSAEGGVSVIAPSNWHIEIRHPTTPSDPQYLRGHERGVMGAIERRGFWVARWSVPEDMSMNSVKQSMRASRGTRRHDVTMGDGELADRPSAVLRYRQSPHGLGRLRLSDTAYTVRHILIGGFLYQVGTWESERWGDRDGALEALVDSFEISDPQPWVKRIDNATLKLPGGWTERPSNIGAARFFAVAPGEPSRTWAYVFHDAKRSPEQSLALARDTITKGKGAIYGERPDGNATRIDFALPDKNGAPTYDIEWIVSDGHGGAYVLSVARRDVSPSLAEALFAGLQVAR